MTRPSSSQANGYTPPAIPAALAVTVAANAGEHDPFWRDKATSLIGGLFAHIATAHAAKRSGLEHRLRLIRAMGTAVAKGFQKGHSRKIYRLAKHGMFGPKEFNP